MIDAAVSMGVFAVEGSLRYELAVPDVEAAKQIREYADMNNVIFPCFSMYVDLSKEDFRERIGFVKKYAEIASILGSPYLHHTVIPEFMDPDAILREKDLLFKKGIDAVREIYDHAGQYGIKAVYEDQGFIFNGTEGFGRFLDEVQRDVGVVADLGNIYQTGCLPENFIKAFAARICHVHIKDMLITGDNSDGKGYPCITGGFVKEVPIGSGAVNFRKCFSLLKSAGYGGYYSIEWGAKDKGEWLSVIENGEWIIGDN